jgi:hypothetical protein
MGDRFSIIKYEYIKGDNIDIIIWEIGYIKIIE